MKNDGICRFYELKKNEEYELSVDEKLPWMAELLHVLEEGIDESEFATFAPSTISFQGHYKKGTGGKFGDYFIFRGELVAHYHAVCVQSGEPMMVELPLSVHLCCIDDENKDEFELEEELIIYLEEEEHDLFFFDGKKINIQEILRELIILEKDQYPVKKES